MDLEKGSSSKDNKYIDPVKAMIEQRKAAAARMKQSPASEPSPPKKSESPPAPPTDNGQNGGASDNSHTALVTVSKSTEAEKTKKTELAKQEAEKGEARLPLGEKLIRKGLISRDQLEIALKVQRKSNEPMMIGQILVDMGFITESALGEILTESAGVEHFDPKSNIIDPNLIKQIPKEIAERFKAVPILLEEDSVYIAMTDIYNVLAIDRIQRYFPKKFKMAPVHCNEADLSELINNYYDYDLSIDGILREIEALSDNAEDLIKLSGEKDGYTNPTVRFVDAILVDAIQKGSSDIHFEPEDQFVRLRYRIDGGLRLIRSFHKDYWAAIAARMKIISGMNIAETRIPQDGRITYKVLGREIAFRVATQPTVHGENVVLRILDKKKSLLTMDQLGFSEPNIKTLVKVLKRPEGIIIVTGPTGSGKTTTLYTILSFINQVDVNIMTLEDPVEYSLPMIRQSNIRTGAGMDFAAGIKSIMRQDPDIIFVGEVRDEQTATMALRAAMTGHQVFTTLHTNDALGAIARLVDIGVPHKLLSGNVIASIAQRLARKLCNDCKKPKKATPEECKILGADDKNPPEIFEHAGCEMCGGTGYRGRIAISEIILVDDGLDDLIAADSSRSVMLKHILSKGFIPMAQDGIDKVLRGVTDLEELIGTINMTDRL